MTLEVFNAVFSAGTFLVIAVTAVAALIQLRHLRATNQLASFMAMGHDFDRPEFLKILTYVRNELPTKMKDPAYRNDILTNRGYDRIEHPEAVVCGYFEQIGILLKHGLADEAVLLDAFAPLIIGNWERLLPFIAVCRELSGPSAWENFEYAASRSYRFSKSHPSGTLPREFQRLPIERATSTE